MWGRKKGWGRTNGGDGEKCGGEKKVWNKQRWEQINRLGMNKQSGDNQIGKEQDRECCRVRPIWVQPIPIPIYVPGRNY